MALTRFIADKSFLVRLARDAVSDPNYWNNQIDRGLVSISTITLLEMGVSTRGGAEHSLLMELPPISLMPVEYLSPAIEKRALEVQRQLAYDGSKHRAPSVADLLIAATAEVRDLTVLADDKDFALIAAVTGQPIKNPTRS